MFDPVYKELAETLREHIRTLDKGRKLPGVRVLGKRFGANPATVSKALRMLRERGVVSIVRGQGAFVLSGKRELRNRIGIVHVIKPDYSETIERDRLSSSYRYTPWTVAQVAEMIGSEAALHGFESQRINLTLHQVLEEPGILAKLPFDGFLFIFSSLTFDFAAVLKANRIPFVAANASFGIPEVNYVDFNETQAISDFIAAQQKRGVRRFGYFGVFGPYGHSEKCRTVFRARLGRDYRERYFVNECFENPLSDYRICIPEYAERAVAKMCSGGAPPEYVICSADYAGDFERSAHKAGVRIPLAVLTMDARLRGVDLLTGDPCALFRLAAKRLVSMIVDEDDSVIQQWVPMQVVTLDEKKKKETVCEC